ncbi:MAG: hypothetical protein HY532_06855 [Chloroflexi bacterium]|nr:hypothetical protein [Chloroflexota bacterium]
MVNELLHSPATSVPFAIGVTSTLRGEGRTTNALGIASTLALETQEPVALVEADVYSPCIAADLMVPGQHGLLSVMTGEKYLEDVLIHSPALGYLALLPAGSISSLKGSVTSGQLDRLLRHNLGRIIADLKRRLSYIVVDLPPVLENINAEVWQKTLDGQFLVVRAGITPRDKVAEAASAIGKGRLLGAIYIGESSAIPGWLQQLI